MPSVIGSFRFEAIVMCLRPLGMHHCTLDCNSLAGKKQNHAFLQFNAVGHAEPYGKSVVHSYNLLVEPSSSQTR